MPHDEEELFLSEGQIFYIEKANESKEDNVTIKDTAVNVIHSLPTKATMDDIIHALYVHSKFQHGQQEIKQGRGILHEDAKKRLRKWVK